MSFKKILASMLAVVAACGMSAAALTLDSAEAANDAVVAEKVVLAADNSNVGNADFENNAGVVFDGTNYHTTLVNALKAVHGVKGAVLYCKPGADLGTMTHGHVCADLTVFGNGAYLSGGEQDFEIDYPAASGNPCSGLTEDVTLTVDNLKGAGAWGSKTSAYAISFVFTNCDNMGKIFYTGTNGELNISLTDCTFTGNNISNCKVYSNTNGTIILDNVDFSGVEQPVALNNKTTGKQTIVLKNCDFASCGAASQDWTVPVSVKSSVAGGKSSLTVDNCTFTGTVTNSIGQDADILLDYGVGSTTSAIVNTTAKVGVETEANVAGYANITAVDTAILTNESAEVKIPVAKVDTVYFATIADAISAAQNGDTIDLLGGVIEFTGSYNGIEGAKTLTFANGTMDFTQARADDSVFFLWGEDLTFNNIKFVKNDVPDAEEKFMCYLMNISDANSDIVFNECEFNFAESISSSYIANNAGGTITFTKCVINECVGSNFVYGGGALFDTCVYNSEEADIIAHNNFPSEIRNSQVVTKRIRIRNVSLTAGVTPTVSITGNSNVKAVVGISYTSAPAAGEENALLFVEAGSTLITENAAAGIIDSTSAGTVVSKADIIAVDFVQVDGDAEGYDLYNINLVGANKETINRLNSADLTFILDKTPVTGGNMSYEIIAVEKITVTPDAETAGRYMFNFNGKTAVNDTANTITLAQVKVSGYGAYSFYVDTNATTNEAHATTISDNIVDTFVPGGATGKGTLNLGDATTGNVTIAVPVRTLTVKVAFPNSVEDNAVLYQDMKVEITGNIDGVQQTVTYDLGGNMTADGTYVVTEDRLVLNDTYNVVVSGAGYRTARYTVTMTDAKTLNFWNNVKDNKVEVEEGKASSATEKNFLAGDIVADNQINIYDLSAVVSYFATEITDEADYEKYVKYDLNRDGVINSKDVAYVLVSWQA